MKSKITMLITVFVMAMLVACGGEDAAVEPTLAAPINKDVAAATEIEIFDRVIFNIQDVSGEIVISDGQKSHTIVVLNSILMEKNFNAENPTILTFVKYDGLLVCTIERKDDRMQASFENNIIGVSCDTINMELVIDGKWDILSNSTQINFEKDYNAIVHLPKEPNEELFIVFNEDGDQVEIEISQLSISKGEAAITTTSVVTHLGAVICTIEVTDYDSGSEGYSISGETGRCDAPFLTDEYTVTIPGFFTLEP